jgi:hypothetical protein
MRKLHATILSVAFAFVLALVTTTDASAGLPASRATVDITARYDHEFHETRVFSPRKIQCSQCHNFSVDQSTGKSKAESGLELSTFRKDMKSICHECHSGAETKNKDAPKACYTCHRSAENLREIKPNNHSNVGWKDAHATNARTDAGSCQNCHTTSQCVQCHQRRNDIEFKNHSRNFRFFHSVQARAQPQKCDACHSRSFCTDCHLGGR